MGNIDKLKKLVVISFLLVPLSSATISAFHLERFLALGNHTYLSVASAVTYEIANITAMLIFVILERIKKSFVWISFIILILMQIIGNIYYSFDYIYIKLTEQSTWVANYFKIMSVITNVTDNNILIFILSVIIGAPVPIIAILLTKSVSDYLSNERNKDSLEKPSTVENDIVSSFSVE